MARKPCVTYRRELVDAIEEVFPPQFFSRFSRHGNAAWTPQRILWVSVVMSWQPRSTFEECFAASCDVVGEVRPRWSLGNSDSSFFARRVAEWSEMSREIVPWLRRQVAAFVPQWRVRGWALFGVDGSRIETPRTTANEAGLGCAGKAATTPQIFQTTILHLGTGLPWDYRLGPGTDSERRHLDDMLVDLPPQSMLVADAGFISAPLCRELIQRGQSFLLRVGGNFTLLRDLGWDVEIQKDEHTVYLWPQKDQNLPPVKLRLIVIQKAGRKPIYLVTNAYDAAVLSEADAEEIYKVRWGLEVYYRTGKRVFDHATLLSRQPQHALVEQHWNVIGIWVLQLITVRELIATHRHPASWSAAKARKAVRELCRKALSDATWRPARSFRSQLQSATLDNYQRSGPKQTRHWPRKKEDHPPGPPKFRPATEQEKQRAKQLHATNSASL